MSKEKQVPDDVPETTSQSGPAAAALMRHSDTVLLDGHARVRDRVLVPVNVMMLPHLGLNHDQCSAQGLISTSLVVVNPSISAQTHRQCVTASPTQKGALHQVLAQQKVAQRIRVDTPHIARLARGRQMLTDTSCQPSKEGHHHTTSIT
eukprot:CAMPEP_0114108382 /NCGR_PEP_ID=MMETSP0043_2-20121206/193_1 /TAXON_ID=464988 /ORGANISM="Hemiselmis andersenii, Strain CCMP644" /LENGTH=148 /DNA_ID=CAMNT_0001200149 /DNA_START=115 /DNA_END=558 /DNA_ORIENTATION=-